MRDENQYLNCVYNYLKTFSRESNLEQKAVIFGIVEI
jgi:hypothetical protein